MASWSVEDIRDQQGRIAVVTGANSGLGSEVGKALAAKGARVIEFTQEKVAANGR